MPGQPQGRRKPLGHSDTGSTRPTGWHARPDGCITIRREIRIDVLAGVVGNGGPNRTVGQDRRDRVGPWTPTRSPEMDLGERVPAKLRRRDPGPSGDTGSNPPTRVAQQLIAEMNTTAWS